MTFNDNAQLDTSQVSGGSGGGRRGGMVIGGGGGVLGVIALILYMLLGGGGGYVAMRPCRRSTARFMGSSSISIASTAPSVSIVR